MASKLVPNPNRSQQWLHAIDRYRQRVGPIPPPILAGQLTRMVGLTLEAVGCQAPIGGRCLIQGSGGSCVEAEVVGFAGDRTFLMPIGDIRGVVPGARVIPAGGVHEVAVGPQLLGRVVDGAGNPWDGLAPIQAETRISLTGRPLNPMLRTIIHEPLDVGVRTINALMTVGRGQRMGLFAGSGVGKSVLLGMMTRHTNADVVVVGLIGERGREVKEFVQNILGKKGMSKAVVVATPADHPPLMRLHGAMLATSIAEYFRDQGKNVLLLMDSLTRFAQAQREIALAVGEPPATKGYPPSVFTKLPQLVERAGAGDHGGSITAFYTVLVEGDDHSEPVADSARAILDGHIVLSRELAGAGVYPAIDVEASISRLMTEIVPPDHLRAAHWFKAIHALYRRNEDLVNVGAYQAGSDPRIDEALALHPRQNAFVRQEPKQCVSFKDSIRQLMELANTSKQIK